jgi:hypothetical protein
MTFLVSNTNRPARRTLSGKRKAENSESHHHNSIHCSRPHAFSKKLDNLKAAVTLYVAFYNFCRIHQTLRVTPAMEAGLTDHVWTIEELLRST